MQPVREPCPAHTPQRPPMRPRVVAQAPADSDSQLPLAQLPLAQEVQSTGLGFQIELLPSISKVFF